MSSEGVFISKLTAVFCLAICVALTACAVHSTDYTATNPSTAETESASVSATAGTVAVTSVPDNSATLSEVSEISPSESVWVPQKEIFEITEDSILECVETLCLSPRKYGTGGEERATAYIAAELAQYGYTVVLQKFPVYKMDLYALHKNITENDFFNLNPYEAAEPIGYGTNIIVEKASLPTTDKVFVISAHYDTISKSVGAVDNASGVSAVMSIAKSLRDYDADANIRYIFFSAEEYYFTGSRYYLNSLSDGERDKIIGCVNFDMVGEKDAGELELHTFGNGDNALTKLYNDSIGSENALNVLGEVSTDYISFDYAGITAVDVMQSDNDYSLQGVENDVEYIDTACIKEAFGIGIEIVKNLSKLDASER